ncbi:MAG: hypothetical protein RSA48_03735 [Bacilli bacterium]
MNKKEKLEFPDAMAYIWGINRINKNNNNLVVDNACLKFIEYTYEQINETNATKAKIFASQSFTIDKSLLLYLQKLTNINHRDKKFMNLFKQVLKEMIKSGTVENMFTPFLTDKNLSVKEKIKIWI